MIPFAKLRSYRGRLQAARAAEAGFTLIEMLRDHHHRDDHGAVGPGA